MEEIIEEFCKMCIKKDVANARIDTIGFAIKMYKGTRIRKETAHQIATDIYDSLMRE